MMDLRELYQDIILDHGRHPRNFRTIEHPTHFAQGHNCLLYTSPSPRDS